MSVGIDAADKKGGTAITRPLRLNVRGLFYAHGAERNKLLAQPAPAREQGKMALPYSINIFL